MTELASIVWLPNALIITPTYQYPEERPWQNYAQAPSWQLNRGARPGIFKCRDVEVNDYFLPGPGLAATERKNWFVCFVNTTHLDDLPLHPFFQAITCLIYKCDLCKGAWKVCQISSHPSGKVLGIHWIHIVTCWDWRGGTWSCIHTIAREPLYHDDEFSYENSCGVSVRSCVRLKDNWFIFRPCNCFWSLLVLLDHMAFIILSRDHLACTGARILCLTLIKVSE